MSCSQVYEFAKGPSIATQLNSTRRRVELSCVTIDALTAWVTTFRRSELIGDSCSRCRVELSCVGVAIDASPTQLNSTRRRDELNCVAINGP